MPPITFQLPVTDKIYNKKRCLYPIKCLNFTHQYLSKTANQLMQKLNIINHSRKKKTLILSWKWNVVAGCGPHYLPHHAHPQGQCVAGWRALYEAGSAAGCHVRISQRASAAAQPPPASGFMQQRQNKESGRLGGLWAFVWPSAALKHPPSQGPLVYKANSPRVRRNVSGISILWGLGI